MKITPINPKATIPTAPNGAPVDLRVALLHPILTVPALIFIRAPRERTADQGAAVPWNVGADAPAAAAGETWGAWAQRKWAETTAGLHRIVYEGAAGGFSGVVVPAETRDPVAARDYLIFAYGRLADAYGWPVDQVASGKKAMIAAGTAATVVDTIARLRPLGPLAAWPGSASWYAIADDMTRSAALVSAGEAAAVVRAGAADYSDELRQVAADLSAKASQAIDAAGRAAQGYGMGLGGGLGVGAAVIGGGVLLYLAWPFIAGGRVAASAAARG